MSVVIKQTKHPYITRNKKLRGGVPVISGTGVRVLDIVIRYEIMGQSPEDIYSRTATDKFATSS